MTMYPVDLQKCQFYVPVVSNAMLRRTELVGFLEQNICRTKSMLSYGTYNSNILYRSGQPKVFQVANKNIILPKLDRPAALLRNDLTNHETFTPVSVRWVDDTTFTQLPEELLQKLEVLDLSETLSPKAWYAKSAPNLMAGSYEATGNKICETAIRVDTLASFSLLGDYSDKNLIADHIPAKIQGAYLSNIYKGNKPSVFKVKTVTKKEILAGKGIFLFKYPVEVLDTTTTTTRTFNCIGAGVFWEASKIKRFKKARDFLLKIINNLISNPLLLLDPETQKKLLSEKLSSLTQFWDSPQELINLSSISFDSTLPEFDLPTKILNSGNHVGKSEYRVLNANAHVKTTLEGKRLSRAEKAHADAVSKLKVSKENILNTKDDVQRHELALSTATKDLVLLNNLVIQRETDKQQYALQIEETEKLLTTLSQRLKVLQKTQDTMKDSYQLAKETFDQKLNEYLDSEEQDKDLFQNLLDSGILIQDIKLRNNKGHEVSILDNPKIILDETYRFTRLDMVTTKPTPIYVDRFRLGDKAEVVYGGPYHIVVASDGHSQVNMTIRLSSMSSVFGYVDSDNGSVEAKIHPHTGSTYIHNTIESYNEFIQQTKTICLGDAQGPIRAGFASKNIKLVLTGVMSWLTSCDSSDDWGRDWDWFPTIDKINLDGQSSKKESIDIDLSLNKMKDILTKIAPADL